MTKIDIFGKHRDQYENWFIKNSDKFNAEVNLIKSFPIKGKGIEIGIGSGLFAEKLGIKYGIDPSFKMIELCTKRDIFSIIGTAENIPIKDKTFDFALIVTAICFVNSVEDSLKDIKRILTKNGSIIIGFVDKDSIIGKKYIAKKNNSIFYKDAIFYSTDEIIVNLKKIGFKNITTKQTLLKNNNNVIKDGHGEGSFVVIKANK